MFWCSQIGEFAKFLLPLIFKNGFVEDIAFSSEKGKFTKIPLALFWMGKLVRNVELLQTLQCKKAPDHKKEGFRILSIAIYGIHTQIYSLTILDLYCLYLP